MRYVTFTDNRADPPRVLGEVRLEEGRLFLSEELAPHWPREGAYALLGAGGHGTMYDPEQTLEALPTVFTEPGFQASEVRER